MLVSIRSRDPRPIAHVAAIVVLADTLFTATAAIAQPITAFLLARTVGWPLTEGWLGWSLALYLFIGIFWLPVVWMQIRLRDLARAARDQSQPLPAAYHQIYRYWFACGLPAFIAILAIMWLMLTKPIL